MSKSQLLSLIKRAESKQAEGMLEEAYKLFCEAVNLDLENDNIWHMLGLIAFELGNISLAIQHISQAITINQSKFIYQRNLGELYRRKGFPIQAVKFAKNATKIAPKDTESHYNLALAYADLGNEKKAIKSYRKTLELNPAHGNAWNNLGSVLEKIGNQVAAKAAYEKAILINPRNAEAQNNIGAIFLLEGKLDEAKIAFERSISTNPKFISAHFNLSALKTYSTIDSQFHELLELKNQVKFMSINEQIRYYFTLGKAFEDTKQYKDSFDAYRMGNELQFELSPVDENEGDKLVNDIINTYNSNFFEERESWTSNNKKDKTPIFIVGMPRSGTSLLEQILATHPKVFGAGELAMFPEISNEVMRNYHSNESAPKSAYDLIGNRYTKELWKLSPSSNFISDKMPANFMQLGLIFLSIPNARIIHSMRDPMDSCFSCFARHFQKGMEFSYSLESLGRYYQRYTTLMNHWKKVLPESFILDVHYEDLVDNTEEQSRKILEFVGTEWNQKCLEFHKNERVTKTASMAQVRKPIYKTSIARWRNFSEDLLPLINLLKTY